LGLAIEDTVSPRVLDKVVDAGTSSKSFAAASQRLLRLANRSISDERVRRMCGRIGEERIEHHQQMQQAFEVKSLIEQIFGKPEGVESPQIACIMCDGGRYQFLDRSLPRTTPRSARKGAHWKESRIGLLLSMSGPKYDCDPQPILPPELCYDAIADKLAEIGNCGKSDDLPQENNSDGLPVVSRGKENDGIVGPEFDHRSMVASQRNWEEFGPLMASQAWYQGFAAAERKVFVSDGSAAIEKLQRTHFSHYTSILDLLHTLA